MQTRTISWVLARIGAGALAVATLISPVQAQTASGRASASSKSAAAQPKKGEATKPVAKKAAPAPKKGNAAEAPKKASAPPTQEKASAKSTGKAPAKDAEAKKAVPGQKAAAGKAAGPKEKAAKAAPATSKKRPQRTASTQPVSKSKPGARKKSKKPEPPCFRPKIQIFRGFHRSESESLALTYCDGKPAPNAVEHLSLIARPTGTKRPKKLPNPQPPPPAPAKRGKGKTARAKKVEEPKPVQGGEWIPGIKLVDEGLVTRLQQVIDHFAAKRVYVISGYRPQSDKSFHQAAKALDFRLEGVKNEALVAFCRTLPDTGCGYYPNSSFVHMDVRPPKTGHIYWIDASGPGESPRYVSSWPPKEKPEPGDDVVLDPAITGESGPSEVVVAEPSRRKKQALEPLPSHAADEPPSLLDVLGAGLAKPKEAVQPPPDIDDVSL